jgi:hypothetical protein
MGLWDHVHISDPFYLLYGKIGLWDHHVLPSAYFIERQAYGIIMFIYLPPNTFI